MPVMTVEYFELVKDYLHPNLKCFINEYKEGNLIILPPFHGCGHRNKNGTRKLINYTKGHQCVTPSWKNYWKKDIKPKYKQNNDFFYFTRYMTQTKDRHLFKTKGYLVYNYKLKKYEHMKDTPMHYDFKSMQQFKEECLFKNALT